MKHEIEIPDDIEPVTGDLVKRFAEALAAKLKRAEDKYGYCDLWTVNDWGNDCSRSLIEHVQKGDPLDVAAYCAFMWHHGWATSAKAVIIPECDE